MFDFDAGKLLIVGVIALIFIPPKDLPRVLREVGRFVRKTRSMASDFQGQFMEAMREADMADIRREAQKLSDSARVDLGFDSVKNLQTHLTDAVEGKPVAADLPGEPRALPATEPEAPVTEPEQQPVRAAEGEEPAATAHPV